MTTEILRPNPDRKVNGEPIKVRDNLTGEFLPSEGKAVPLTQYWLRLLRRKDVLRGSAAVKTYLTLTDAIDHCMSSGDEAHLTKGGKPDCNVLSELVGENITAKQRDAELAKRENDK